MSDLEYEWLDRCLRIRAHTPDNAECLAALEGVVDDVDIEIQHARVTGDATLVETYTALRAFLKDTI